MLYVGGLSEAASDYQLRDLLGSYGTVVHACVIRYKRSKKSAGYGFVEMGSREEALRAVTALDGAMFEDNRLRLFLRAPGVTPA
jgi:RNA recognition motif-containing protein